MPRKYIRRKAKSYRDIEKESKGLESYLQPGTLKYDLTASRTRKSDDWLMTYTDMVTLLITLFIVMIAHATFEKKEDSLIPLIFPDHQRGENPKAGVGESAQLARGDVIYLGDFPEPGKMAGRQKTPLRESAIPVAPADPEKIKRAEILRRVVNQAGLQNAVTITIVDGDIEVSIHETVLFPAAEIGLFPQGQDFLADLLPTLHSGAFDIIIEGHTDNVPIATEQYPSNWELSAARALAVVHYLEGRGIPSKRLQAVAFGKTRPLVSNETAQGRSKNRRVQIVLR